MPANISPDPKKMGPFTRNSELTEQMGESAKEAAHLRAELILTRHRVNELDERNTVNRDTLVAKLEQWVPQWAGGSYSFPGSVARMHAHNASVF